MLHLAAYSGFAALNITLPVNSVAGNLGQPARTAVDAVFDGGKMRVLFDFLSLFQSQIRAVPMTTWSSSCSSFAATVTSWTLAAVTSTVWTNPLPASTPGGHFMPKCHWCPFFAWRISGSRFFPRDDLVHDLQKLFPLRFLLPASIFYIAGAFLFHLPRPLSPILSYISECGGLNQRFHNFVGKDKYR